MYLIDYIYVYVKYLIYCKCYSRLYKILKIPSHFEQTLGMATCLHGHYFPQKCKG